MIVMNLHRTFTLHIAKARTIIGADHKTSGGSKTMEAFTVILNRRPIDTVYFQTGSDPEHVRVSLIMHDGYSPEINVIREVVYKAVNGAIATRGKNKGQLKAKCPPMNTDAAAAWQAIQMQANPYKVSMGACLFFNLRQTKIFNAVLETIQEKNIDVRGLDRDRVALEELGAW
jgi:hypothetical protein